MRYKNKFILVVLMLLISISNVFAITSSNSNQNYKIAIYPYGDNTCSNEENNTNYYNNVGSYYNKQVDDNIGKEYYNSYEHIEGLKGKSFVEKEAAIKACEIYTTSDEVKDNNYICEGTEITTAYYCPDQRGENNQLTGSVTSETLSNLNDILNYYNFAYNSEAECNSNCNSECNGTMQDTYYFTYYKIINDKENNDESNIEDIKGRIFQTSSGDLAFCIQPDLPFVCMLNSNKEAQPQYCLDTHFDLSVCNTKEGYKQNYQCGMALIILEAYGTETGEIDEKEKLEKFGYVETALRMWASYKGVSGVSGSSIPTVSTGSPNPNTNIAKTYFYGITASRVIGDKNYEKYGLECNTYQSNASLICGKKDQNVTYKKALELFMEAYNAEKYDTSGNRVPTLLTNSLIHKGENTYTFTVENPTGESCGGENEPCTFDAIAECNETEGCTITVDFTNSSGDKVSEIYCEKNYCEINVEINYCNKYNQTKVHKVEIKYYEMSGGVKIYYNCNNPSERQIMYTFEGTLKETKDTITHLEYINLECDNKECNDELPIDNQYETKCKNIGEFNSEDVDYNSLATIYDKENKELRNYGYIGDPDMKDILNSCHKQYYLEKSISNICNIYCRDEIKFYLPNKEKVFAGMQFKYDLQNIADVGFKTEKDLSAVVYKTRHCVSEIDYNEWEKKYDEAMSSLASALTEWSKYNTLLQFDKIPVKIVSEVTYSCDGSNEDWAEMRSLGSIGCGSKDDGNKVCLTCNSASLVWPSGYVAYEYHSNSNSFSTVTKSSLTEDIPMTGTGSSGYSCATVYECSCWPNNILKPGENNSHGSADNGASFPKVFENQQDCNNIENYKCSPIKESKVSKGSCNSPQPKDPEVFINEKIASAEANLNTSLIIVRTLLYQIMDCNLYGNGLYGESISNINILPETDSFSGDISLKSVDDDELDIQYVDKNGNNLLGMIIDSNIRNVNSELISSIPTKMFGKTSESYKSEKNRINIENNRTTADILFSNNSCDNESNCTSLTVTYKDTVFGKDAVSYKRIIKSNSNSNSIAYCTDPNCDGSKVSQLDPVKYSIPKIVDRSVILNGTNIQVPQNGDYKYASLKTSTVIGYYRPLSYYTEAFTGNVKWVNDETSFNEENYTFLGSNIYPISKDKINGVTGSENGNGEIYSVEFKFTNLGDKFSEDGYSYKCSYEVYNNVDEQSSVSNPSGSKTPIPEYGGKIEDVIKSSNISYKNVDLNDLFVNDNNIPTNWSQSSDIIEKIEDNSDILSSYSEKYSVTLTPDAIKKIKEYNRQKNNSKTGYLNNSLFKCQYNEDLGIFENCQSYFMNDINRVDNIFGVIVNN